MPLSGFASIAKMQLNSFCDFLVEGVMLVDSEGLVLGINNAARQLYAPGMTPQAGLPLSDFSPVDWVEVKKVITSSKPLLRRKVTLPRGIAMVNRVPLTQDGKTGGVVSTFQHLHELDEVAPHLANWQHLDALLHAMGDSVGEGLLVVDPQGKVLRANRAYCALTGLPRERILEHHISQLSGDKTGIPQLLGTVLQSRGSVSQHCPAEGHRPLWATCTPCCNAAGDLLFALAVVREEPPACSPAGAFRDSFFASAEMHPSGVESFDPAEYPGIVAASSTMRHVIQRSLKVSKVDSAVLLQGESGVGKTTLASMIHENSPRREKAFVVIDCGAIPEQLMESELFGYARGAFTGSAPQGKAGLLEVAHEGTVFLDEVGELSLTMQAKLLKAIEQKRFTRLGSTNAMQVDFRIIAATNKDLKHEVEKGSFRKDLYYRLNVIPITIPPLSERKEDIVVLVLQIIRQHNEKFGVNKRIANDVMDCFMEYGFPGNMRELINVMEWILVMSEHPLITLDDLPSGIVGAPRKVVAAAVSPSAAESPAPMRWAVSRTEEEWITRALDEHTTLQEAARSLGMHKTTLWRKMRSLGIRHSKHKEASRE